MAADGNSSGPQTSGVTGGAEGYIAQGKFPEVLDEDQIYLHLMNNSVIRDAAEDLNRQSHINAQAEQYGEALANFYGDPHLTYEDVDALDVPDNGSMGQLSKSHARQLVRGREDYARAYAAEAVKYEERVEEELEIVVATFETLGQLLNGNGPDSVQIRQRIEEVNAAVEAVISGAQGFLDRLDALEGRAASMDRGEVYQELRTIGQEIEDWAIQHSNPHVAGQYRDWTGVAYNLESQRLDGPGLVRGFKHQVLFMQRSAEGIYDDYPTEYKNYNSLMSGYHLRTWSEFWWMIATEGLWFIAAEVATQVVALALAPVTAGASVVVINAARHVQRTKFLGGIVRGIRNSAQLRRAGTVARWIVELPDRVADRVLAGFDSAARRALGLSPRRSAAGQNGADIEGNGTAPPGQTCLSGLCAL